MKKSVLYLLYAILSVYFLITLFVTSLFLFRTNIIGGKKNTEKETEYVYIYVKSDTESETNTNSNTVWIVKEYNERIGIYDSNGILLDVIETYVKTLPTTEQQLLKEGFEVSSEKELYSVIEDYTD